MPEAVYRMMTFDDVAVCPRRAAAGRGEPRAAAPAVDVGERAVARRAEL